MRKAQHLYHPRSVLPYNCRCSPRSSVRGEGLLQSMETAPKRLSQRVDQPGGCEAFYNSKPTRTLACRSVTSRHDHTALHRRNRN